MDTTKFIIYNHTNLSDFETFKFITKVIEHGKISKTKYGDQYCFVTTFEYCTVICSLNKKGTTKFEIVPNN